jgi:hypothetical protein
MPCTFIRVNAININGQEELSFAVDGNPASLMLLTVAPDKPPLDAFMNMQSDPAAPTAVMTTAGQALVQDLGRHSNFVHSLASTLSSMGPDCRINVEIPPVARAAHNYPWEVLHHGANFIANNPGIPFLRIVPPITEARRDEAVFEGSLRVLAVIAAADVTGANEWHSLKTALGAWPRSLDCLVLVNEPELKATIDGSGLADVRCELVPTSLPEFLHNVDQLLPHVVHIFCHGRADRSARLEIASNNTAYGAPPLFVSAAELANHLRTAWLVTLNACSSGQANAAANANSIASELVERGVPFVTSMRQEVPANVANCFTRAFYTSWLGQLHADVSDDQPFELSVDGPLVEARSAILQTYGGPQVEDRIKEWSLPIACAGSTSFKIRLTAEGSSLDQRSLSTTVSEIAQLRNALGAGGWSDHERQLIQQRIEELQRKMGGGGA